MHVSDCDMTFLQAFYIYEYIITLDREVELFWKKKVNGGAAIFLSNRYIPLITQLMYLVEYTSSIMSDKVCLSSAPALASVY